MFSAEAQLFTNLTSNIVGSIVCFSHVKQRGKLNLKLLVFKK